MFQPDIKIYNPTDSSLSKFIYSVKTAIEFILKSPGTSSIEVDVVLKVGNNLITHSLGQAPRGYYVVRSNGPVTVNEVDSIPANATTINMVSSAAVTAKIVIY